MYARQAPGFAPSYDAKFIKSTNIVRQSAYFISVIPTDKFITHGAKYVEWGIYYIPKVYGGTPTNETCALLGIPLLHVDQFYTPTSELIDQLKMRDEFQHITSIDQLTCMQTCETLKRFKEKFDNCDNSYLLLLNIEPKGTGKFSLKYPTPRITLPGGTMEDSDCNDFERCALREFVEETHIDIENSYDIIAQRRLIKDIKHVRKRKFGMYFFGNKSFDTSNTNGDTGDTICGEISGEVGEEATEAEEVEEEEEKVRQVKKVVYHHHKKRGKNKMKTVSMFFFIKIH